MKSAAGAVLIQITQFIMAGEKSKCGKENGDGGEGAC